MGTTGSRAATSAASSRTSKGFLWFCGAKGLSRFDGVRFVRFGAADGLADGVVVDIVEEPGSGTYWVGTNEGLFRFVGDRPAAAGRLFEKVDLPIGGSVRRLLLDRAGRLWVGTTDGLAVLEPGREGHSARQIAPEAWARDKPIAVYALVADASGAIWAGTHDDGVCRIAPTSTARAAIHGTSPDCSSSAI
jgi:ligand-binding sensor domain-containing protein